ncbi:MAG: (Fe-S)-binding protein, partial [Chloroflexota bacterium]
MNETSPQPAYQHLVERLNRFPQGAPPAEALTQILQILFSAEEAELVSILPIKPFTAEQASQVWKTDLNSARKILESLASRAILLDIEQNGESVYVLPPPMAGFFEFSLMRYRNDVDQKLLSELFYQYLTIEDDFMG